MRVDCASTSAARGPSISAAMPALLISRVVSAASFAASAIDAGSVTSILTDTIRAATTCLAAKSHPQAAIGTGDEDGGVLDIHDKLLFQKPHAGGKSTSATSLRAPGSKKDVFRQLLRKRLPQMGGESQYSAKRAHPHADSRHRSVGVAIDDNDRAQLLAARRNSLVFNKKPRADGLKKRGRL